MGILDFLKTPDINPGLARFKNESRAVLIDVRKPEEYAAGHVPRSRNIPLDEIAKAESALPDKNLPIYVYCEKGSRSKKACAQLEKMGYTNVRNIGGFETYKGKAERGNAKNNKALNSMKAQAVKSQKQEPWNKNMPKM
ncbi:MAG: rhodanese-like domain-containing protein [Lachnospiraceae bacterium]|nr:rhodanese-like domain-containing protein [Lachnospiraceae bacterium]